MKAGVVGMEKYLQSCNSEFWQSVYREELNYLLNHLKGTKDILSIGCGPAIIETGLAKYGFNVTGLDISREALNQAPDNVRKVTGSAEKTDFPDCSFDAVIYVVSLQFIEKYKEAVKETSRILKPIGKILALLLNPESEFFKEKTKNPDSYINKIRHADLIKIKKTIAEYFSIETEYILGIKGAEIFQSTDSNIASLYFIKGIKKQLISVMENQNPCTYYI